MKQIHFKLNGGLTENDLYGIHKQVLEVLEKVGVLCMHQKSLDVLSTYNGIEIIANRIHFKPYLVEEYIQKMRDEFKDKPVLSEEVTLHGPWNCFNIEDMDTAKIRPSTLNDVKQMFKLLQKTRKGSNAGYPLDERSQMALTGISPVFPTDVPPSMQLLALEKAGLENAETYGSCLDFNDDRMLEFCISMYKTAGRKYILNVQYPISPLKINHYGLECIWKNIDREGVHIIAAGPIPQAGLTAPLSLPACLVQAAAETIAYYMVARLLFGNKVTCHPHFRLDLADMRSMVVAYGSPDYHMLQLILNDVAEFYMQRPVIHHDFLCNALKLDIQAAHEKTAQLLMLALRGFRNFFLGAGQLGMDEIFSPACYLFDLEIINYVNHVIKGLKYDDSTSAFEIIKVGAQNGDYLTHDSTLENFRDLYDSNLFKRVHVESWKASGEPGIRETLITLAKALIKSCDYSLPSSVQTEIDRIYKEAEEYAQKN